MADDKIPVREIMGRPGYLHRKLQVPEGKKLPLAKLREAAASDNKLLAKRADLALQMRKWNPK